MLCAGNSKIAWGTGEHYVRLRHEIPILLLAKFIDQFRQQTEIQYRISSPDKWAIREKYTSTGKHAPSLCFGF